MKDIADEELIKKAASVINKREIGGFTVGDVGCALITHHGNIFTGVSIDTSSGMGFCAEHSAIAAMVTAGESEIRKLVAVWKENEDLYVLPPCGRCRQFIYKINETNLNADIILGKNNLVKLIELIPHHDEFKKI